MTEEAELRRRIADLTEELSRLKLTLEVVGTMDLEAGILNRTGVLDALERSQRWLARRGDIYGLVVVRFPVLDHPAREGSESAEFAAHVAATMGAAVRDVDSVGRIDGSTFAAVLADLNPGAIEVVAERLLLLVDRLARSMPETHCEVRIGAVEVLAPHPSGVVLEAALDRARGAPAGEVAGGRLD